MLPATKGFKERFGVCLWVEDHFVLPTFCVLHFRIFFFFWIFFIKNGSHNTIHTFKNYFVIVFFSFQFSAVFKRTDKVSQSTNAKLMWWWEEGGKFKAWLVDVFKHMFSIIKQHCTYFHVCFHPHVFSKKLKTIV